MLRTRDGSREAFEQLVRIHAGRLIAFFQRQGTDADRAEDYAQEVFVRVYQARERYGPSARFSTWLFTIARNYWIDCARARRVRPREYPLPGPGSGEVLTPMLRDCDPGPGQRAEVAEEIGRLRRALDRLPDGQRAVLELGVIEGLPYAEVGRVLGVPVGTVKSRVHAAVHRLRGLLGEPLCRSRPGSVRSR